MIVGVPTSSSRNMVSRWLKNPLTKRRPRSIVPGTWRALRQSLGRFGDGVMVSRAYPIDKRTSCPRSTAKILYTALHHTLFFTTWQWVRRGRAIDTDPTGQRSTRPSSVDPMEHGWVLM